jgi:precorrin-6A/cobalt-precorrin-6A reductase
VHVLILGGTTEARQLANALSVTERVTTSLAGRTLNPILPAGEVRIGGFGGVDGLASWLRSERVDALIDATHPFAHTISGNAALAAAQTNTPLLMLRRPSWVAQPGDLWHAVATLEDAATILPTIGDRVFLTTGRQSMAQFAHLDLFFVARSVEAPEPPLPVRLEIVLDRGPFDVNSELALLHKHAVNVIVTKDSGAAATSAKLVAAREIQVPVVIVQRPPEPVGVPVVDDVASAVGWLHG